VKLDTSHYQEEHTLDS